MKRRSRRLAFCAMTASMSVTLMLVLGLTGVGTYAAPMIAALLLIPIRKHYGVKTGLTVWVAAGLLALLIVTDRELALVYLTMFGWYPVIRPKLMGLPRGVSILLRYALFNVVFLLTYTIFLSALGIEGAMWPPSIFHVVFLLLMNLIFFVEDTVLIPRVEILSERVKY